MSQRPSAPPGGGQDRPDEEWPDDLWPDDAATPAGQAVPPGPGGKRSGRARPAVLAVLAIGAAAVGAVIVLAVQSLSGSPSSGATPPASAPSFLGPGQSARGGQPGVNGGPPGGGAVNIFMVGRVTAVTSTSITIGGPGRTQTAKVTRATKITGNVSGISGIKVGDQVSAQLTVRGGTATAVSIADPAQPPTGGSLP